MSIALRYAIAFCLVVMIVLQLGPGDARGALVINEILADPDSDWNGNGLPNYRDDEWIEILNTGPEVEDLSRYFLRDITDLTPHIALSGVLQPGAVLVVFGSDAVLWQQQNDVNVSGLSLNNTGDTVELVRVEDGDLVTETIVDSVSYADHEAEDERSGGRDAETGQWLLFDGLNPYQGDDIPTGTGCMPSPGQVNTCTPEVAARPAAWDQVKSLYR